MNPVIVPVAALARRRIARHFIEQSATRADHAIFYEPGLRIRRRMFERLRKDGTIRSAPGGMYYLDAQRYEQERIRRRTIVAALLGALAFAGAAIALMR